MRATTIHGPGDIRVEQVPDAAVRLPTDAVVRVELACICGSDLWAYRGVAKRAVGQRIGHEFLGEVVEIGAEVTSVRVGDRVIAPFVWSDGTCAYCAAGLQTSCVDGGFWGSNGSDGGQGEAVRVPHADGTLVPFAADVDEAALPGLLTLSDVLGTGHHAARAAGVGPGSVVAVVGDGAVGLCGVLAAKRLGAERIISLGRHEDRAAIAKKFGATDQVAERGEAAVARVRELTGGLGAPAVLECVGTEQSWQTAMGIARDGGRIGYVGVPHEMPGLPLGDLFGRNISVAGGVAPVRAYLPELLADVLAGTIDPSPVFDRTVGLDQVADGYVAMDERTALKVIVRP
ncbi:zinc-dependent alcohol dehydrogenase family protein [Solihabitans fulvus]|uniref:Zinc-dependent alcohol dehydrogenase family protein n=1 Tax=Solihabitans fulvus TaxID=1892852 RepID=A0A5B2XDZ1_9PSEU|nr:zinc-dependent alcohol dehydrogenase family protein [Solihabitans fulvus]KAA2261259.1 zinc-dependent alcohol dehydrogenase family protein [Solihabitans fulvus]